MKRRFLPIFLAALCWLLVALVPATRNGLFRAGQISYLPEKDQENPLLNGDFAHVAQSQFPADRRVNLEALTLLISQTDGGMMERVVNRVPIAKIDAATRVWKHDPTAISLLLRAYISALQSDRIEGPLTNPGGPGAPVKKLPGGTSPFTSYDRFIALARRGQKLEPDNTFFDWFVIYGLFATRRDAEARHELKLAARKTRYNDHSREIILNRIAVMRLTNGAPLSTRENLMAWATTFYPELSKMRQGARWVTEGAIADRNAGRHQRALDAAFDLTKLGRVMRRDGYTLINSLVGSAIEGIAISRAAMPPPLSSTRPRTRSPRFGAPLATYQASPISLYAYAKSRNRADITRFLDREWVEIGQWRALNKVIIDQEWTGNSHAATTALTGVQRLNALILRALPSILILGAVFTLLSRRFRDDSGAQLSFDFRRRFYAALAPFPR